MKFTICEAPPLFATDVKMAVGCAPAESIAPVKLGNEFGGEVIALPAWICQLVQLAVAIGFGGETEQPMDAHNGNQSKARYQLFMAQDSTPESYLRLHFLCYWRVSVPEERILGHIHRIR